MTQQLTCSINDACRIIGLSRSGLYNMIKAGTIDTVMIGCRRMVKVESLRALVDRAA